MKSSLSKVDSAHLKKIVGIHFDPQTGTPYWLNQAQKLRVSVFDCIESFEDFQKYIGFQNIEEQRQFEADTRYKSLEHFIPQSILKSDRTIWASQTGGTTGPPKHGNWDSAYWGKILEFSDEFLDLHKVPRDANWLFIGPTGPHTTGRLIISIAENRGGLCFTIDLDPRIVKIYGSLGMHDAYSIYIKHIWKQVESVIKYQNISVMFCTSRLLEMLPEYLDIRLFSNIKAIVHAGTSMDCETNRLLKSEMFPNTSIVGLYGTSTTGISYQKPGEDEHDYSVIYIPSSPYIVLQIVDDNGQSVGYGEVGNVATYRLTEDSLIPGFWERDKAIRVKPFGVWAKRYPWDWISDVYSPEFTVEGKVEGVY